MKLWTFVWVIFKRCIFDVLKLESDAKTETTHESEFEDVCERAFFFLFTRAAILVRFGISK